ncbi:MAG: ATP-binding protein, partial [Steroidobacteraceae bacterium]
LDELPEFARSALEALREPLETGRITISRAARQAQFPAAFQLIAAMNPCPCGWLGAFEATGRACRCTPDAVARYQGRLSGPLLDRIDLVVEVPAVKPQALLDGAPGEPSSPGAERVAAARQRQQRRQTCLNGLMDAAQLARCTALQANANRLLTRTAEKLGWSGRALHRGVKGARTIADLDASEPVLSRHVAEAIQYRRGLPGAQRSGAQGPP